MSQAKDVHNLLSIWNTNLEDFNSDIGLLAKEQSRLDMLVPNSVVIERQKCITELYDAIVQLKIKLDMATMMYTQKYL